MNLLIRTGVFLALLTACGSETPSTCAAGRVKPCPCASGQGAQTCQRDGTFGACVCPDAGAGMDVTLDASDAPACDADLQNDPGNCGGCGRRCEGGPDAGNVCRAGRCALVCDPAHTDCDGNPANGCETTLNTNLNCAGCGMACAAPNATVECQARACVLRSCASGFADCDGNLADGCETDTANDSMNCGRCSSRDPALAICRTGTHCVRGQCEPLDCTDGGTCPAGSMCCPVLPGRGTGRRCYDPTRDPSNCGACGRMCMSTPNASATCSDAHCGIRCSEMTGNCDGDDSNGCEALFSRDPLNCGACGRACADTEDCQSGVCLNVVTPGCPSRCTRNADCGVCPTPGLYCCNSGRCYLTVGRCAGS